MQPYFPHRTVRNRNDIKLLAENVASDPVV